MYTLLTYNPFKIEVIMLRVCDPSKDLIGQLRMFVGKINS